MSIPAAGSIDRFGVPDRIFGPHPEDFWGAVGRTVGLAALLEDQLVALLQALTGKPPREIARFPGTAIVLKLASAAPRDNDWSAFPAFLARADAALRWRHEIAHNLWPAHGDPDDLFGHRLDRTGSRVITETSPTELRRQIGRLVELVLEDRWLAMAHAVDRRGSER